MSCQQARDAESGARTIAKNAKDTNTAEAASGGSATMTAVETQEEDDEQGLVVTTEATSGLGKGDAEGEETVDQIGEKESGAQQKQQRQVLLLQTQLREAQAEAEVSEEDVRDMEGVVAGLREEEVREILMPGRVLVAIVFFLFSSSECI